MLKRTAALIERLGELWPIDHSQALNADNVVIVGEVEVSLDLKKMLPCNPGCYRGVMEGFIC